MALVAMLIKIPSANEVRYTFPSSLIFQILPAIQFLDASCSTCSLNRSVSLSYQYLIYTVKCGVNFQQTSDMDVYIFFLSCLSMIMPNLHGSILCVGNLNSKLILKILKQINLWIYPAGPVHYCHFLLELIPVHVVCFGSCSVGCRLYFSYTLPVLFRIFMAQYLYFLPRFIILLLPTKRRYNNRDLFLLVENKVPGGPQCNHQLTDLALLLIEYQMNG